MGHKNKHVKVQKAKSETLNNHSISKSVLYSEWEELGKLRQEGNSIYQEELKLRARTKEIRQKVEALVFNMTGVKKAKGMAELI